ncbi:MAG: acylneuraminate cytidylyltransferase family protein [Candidatus Paceibacterota bacterium]
MINELNVLAIIPARGGSKRIPKKNIKPLCGKPLMQYSVEHALGSQYIDRTIVSTDSEEIAELSKTLGAEVPFLRPPEIAGDSSTDFDAFFHALTELKEREGYVPDIIVQLRPTSPMRTVAQVDLSIELLVKHPEADSVRTVTRPEQSPYKMFTVNEETGFLEPLIKLGNDEAYNKQELSLPKAYKHVGYIDTIWAKTILEKKVMSGNMVPMMLDEAYSGINQPNDWDLYEYLMDQHNKKNNG